MPLPKDKGITSEEIKELIDEVRTSQEAPLERAKLLASMLQAYYLAKITEELSDIYGELALLNHNHPKPEGKKTLWQRLRSNLS